ncbi:hypothetical protein DFP72DRAFT_1042219 [Ephemerocybe angulata]|uniref:Uncharacterized protein n=1 Tax=Ephemerocybe angulata TaxID=980116 RepID=A0A8H6M9Y2_9AGAR|nr:hypothetical protein DFP72DRAFT_1042219 [Tulosesus angulatus]
MSLSIMKNTVTSPVRSMMTRPGKTRSILRRPAGLPLSPTPFPYHASFSVLASAGSKSPHVQFMSSPQLVATFTTHSSDTYDRAPIKVSPNPLELPSRGDRYFSPSLAEFKLSAPPKPKATVQKRLDSILRSSQQCASPAITEFEDPRSPKVATDVAHQIRFAALDIAAPAHAPRDLKGSIASYPRSPYPSAGIPSEVEASEEAKPVRRMSDSSVELPTRSMTVSTAPRKARGPASFTPIPSPLQQSFKNPIKTPLTASLQRSHRPAPLAISPQDDATALSDAFWDAVTLESETPMVTALEYPESAMDMEEVNLQSPNVAMKSPGLGLVFGTQDGGVWSPAAAPKQPAARESLLRSALMSPGKAAFTRVKRSYIASPSPNDPFASFPSFAAALTMAQSDPAITYPAPVAMA